MTKYMRHLFQIPQFFQFTQQAKKTAFSNVSTLLERPQKACRTKDGFSQMCMIRMAHCVLIFPSFPGLPFFKTSPSSNVVVVKFVTLYKFADWPRVISHDMQSCVLKQ